MKISKKNLSEFKDLGTVVYYKKRLFYPELTVIKEDVLEDYLNESMSNGYMYSSNLDSDILDFAKYQFDYNLEKEKYWSSLRPNLYTQETINKIGEETFEKIERYFLPQLSSEVSEEKLGNKFFGSVKSIDKTESIYMLRLNSDIWKIEVYNEKITTNNIYNDSKFVDYDVLEKVEKDYGTNYATNIPVLSIYFGPQYDTRIKEKTAEQALGLDFYSDRYFGIDINLFKEEYDNFSEVLTETEYSKKFRSEVLGEKILLLKSSDLEKDEDGNIKTNVEVDLFSVAYENSTVKHRNQKSMSFRGDQELDNQIIDKTSNNLIFDYRNRVLLGNKSCDIEKDCPILYNIRKNINSDNYTPYHLYREGESVKINGKVYSASKTYNYGRNENPEISPFWTIDTDVDNEFKTFYISSGIGGNVSPSGSLSRRNDKTVELSYTLQPGFELDTINFKGDINKSLKKIVLNTSDIEESDNLRLNFKVKEYDVDIYFECENDIPKFNTTSSSLLDNLKEIYNIDTIYFDYESGEYMTYNSSDSIKISYDKPLIIKFDTSESYYQVENLFCNNEKYKPGTDGFYKIELAKNNINTYGFSLESTITVKKYTINIYYDSGIQISCSNTSEHLYGETFSFYFESSEKEVSITLYKDNIKCSEWSVKDKTNYKEFLLKENIKNNYKIYLNYENQ